MVRNSRRRSRGPLRNDLSREAGDFDGIDDFGPWESTSIPARLPPMELHIHGTEVMNDIVPLVHDFRHAAPDVMKAFADLHGATMKPGALDTKTKELIALAISVSKQCDGCIASHAKGAAKAGATDAEVADMLGVVVLMNGGPATVYGPRALSAFRDFAGGVAT